MVTRRTLLGILAERQSRRGYVVLPDVNAPADVLPPSAAIASPPPAATDTDPGRLFAEGRPFAELRDHGLLWLINRTVFHPRGYALALHVRDDGAVTGWSLLGPGSEPWVYAEEIDEDEAFRAAEALMASVSSEVTHACPPEGAGVTPCCGSNPLDLPRTDRLTIDVDAVTCRRVGTSR